MDKCWNHIVTQLFWEYFIAVYGNLSVNMISKYGQANQHLIAGSTTLVISILFPTKAVLIQSSTLAGLMDYSRTYQSIAFVLVTGIFVLIINRVFDKICSDIGGKSGCIGFFANFFTTLICYLISFTKWYEFDVTGLMWDPSEYAVMDKFVLISTPFITAMASVSIHLVIRHKESFIKIAGKNGGYGIIAIFGSLWFQAISSEFIIKRGNAISYGEYCIIFWNAGCMCGLTDKRFFKKWIPGYEFHNYLIIGFITGWLRIGTMGIANLGGKQGICAFIASMFFIWTLEIFNWYFEFDKGEKEQEAEITRNLNTISGTITERTPVNDQIKDGNKSSERNDEGNDVNDRNYEGNEDGNEDGNDNNKVDNIQELHIMREIENGLNGMNMRKISTKTIDTLTFNENFNNVISNEMMDNQLTIVEGNTANNIIYNNYEKVDLMSPPCKYESNRSNQIVELSVNDFEIKLSNTENKRILKNLEDSNYSDSKIIDKLKKELVKIVSKLNITLTRLSDTEQKLDNVEVKCEDLENTIKALNDSLLTAKQEILRLELENAKEIEKSNNYYEMYQYIVLEKEKMEFSMIYDIKQLKNKISFVKSEKEHMSNMLKIHNINNEQILNIHKIKEENQNYIKTQETQINKLQNIIMNLNSKIGKKGGNLSHNLIYESRKGPRSSSGSGSGKISNNISPVRNSSKKDDLITVNEEKSLKDKDETYDVKLKSMKDKIKLLEETYKNLVIKKRVNINDKDNQHVRQLSAMSLYFPDSVHDSLHEYVLPDSILPDSDENI